MGKSLKPRLVPKKTLKNAKSNISKARRDLSMSSQSLSDRSLSATERKSRARRGLNAAEKKIERAKAQVKSMRGASRSSSRSRSSSKKSKSKKSKSKKSKSGKSKRTMKTYSVQLGEGKGNHYTVKTTGGAHNAASKAANAKGSLGAGFAIVMYQGKRTRYNLKWATKDKKFIIAYKA